MERTFEDNKSIKGNSQTLFASPERSSLEDLTTDAELFMSDYHLVSEVRQEVA